MKKFFNLSKTHSGCASIYFNHEEILIRGMQIESSDDVNEAHGYHSKCYKNYYSV